MENCGSIAVFVKVNVHFFLDDDCEGNVAFGSPTNSALNPENVFALAEEAINNANDFMENISDNAPWNQAVNGVDVTEPQCVPVRYVLSGVYVHCSTDAQHIDGFSFFTNNPQFFVNQSSEINLFISELDFPFFAGSSPSGVGINGSNYAFNDDLTPGLFAHELGHVCNLNHTFHGNGNDGCSDTWGANWSWDSNGDGVNDLSNDNCWDEKPNAGDLNNNGIIDPQEDYCNEDIFPDPHPCCEWTAQNNNVMAYGTYAGNPEFASMTPCQVERMLVDLADNMCDYIEVVGDPHCPPPSANIGLLPMDGILEDDCYYCIYLEATMNDRYYKIEIEEVGSTGSTTPVFETDWKDGPVLNYCYHVNSQSPKSFLVAGNTYIITLTVKNECGQEDQASKTIELPLPRLDCMDEEVFFRLTPNPNPATDVLYVNYELDMSGEVEIFITGAFDGTNEPVIPSQEIEAGIYQQAVDISALTPGVYYIIYRLDYSIFSVPFIKQIP